MELIMYRINAFSNQLNGGNPACVVRLNKWLKDEKMLAIAKKNGVPETAFFIKKENTIHLRWFTPEIEMDLCGHATLAAAHCLKKHLKYNKEFILFQTKSGQLKVSCSKDIYHMDLPKREGKLASLPKEISNALNISPLEIYKARDYLLLYENQTDIERIKIDRNIFDLININPGGVIVTAPGKNCDFVSRFFTPQATILEDPVTGSAHCTLIPFWSRKLNKKIMLAKQLSKRGGEIFCKNKSESVIVSGYAITCLQTNLVIN